MNISSTSLQVLYRRDGTVNSTLLQTIGHNINIPILDEGDYIVEVRAYGEGGDGAVDSIKISKSKLLDRPLSRN